MPVLFFCSLVPRIISSGIMPLVPIYALQLGASQAVTGYYFAVAFVVGAAGAYLGGWLADKYQRRKLSLIVSSVTMIPCVWMMGQA